MDTKVGKSKTKDILVIKDFLNEFLDDLPKLSPDREIEFSIDLILGTAFILLALYKMTPLELKESKVQLQELVEKRFIKSSVSL